MCPNPTSGYSTSDIVIAGIIDFFFLPYEDTSVSILRDFADCGNILFLFFITEEFVAWNWVAVTAKRGLARLTTYAPIYLGILLGATMILKQRFGIYFFQFKSFKITFLNIASWALGTPKNELDADFDLMNDNQSWVLAIYFLAVSFFVLVMGSNIFISIVMDAYSAAREQEGTNYKYRKMRYFVVRQESKGYRDKKWFRYVFPHVHIPFNKRKFQEALSNITSQH